MMNSTNPIGKMLDVIAAKARRPEAYASYLADLREYACEDLDVRKQELQAVLKMSEKDLGGTRAAMWAQERSVNRLLDALEKYQQAVQKEARFNEVSLSGLRLENRRLSGSEA